MKANKNNRKAQFGRLGVISLIALSLSANQAMAAFELWTTPKGELVSHLTDKTEIDKAVGQILGGKM